MVGLRGGVQDSKTPFHNTRGAGIKKSGIDELKSIQNDSNDIPAVS